MTSSVTFTDEQLRKQWGEGLVNKLVAWRKERDEIKKDYNAMRDGPNDRLDTVRQLIKEAGEFLPMLDIKDSTITLTLHDANRLQSLLNYE